ncbi:thermonuclease family protein [Muricoccus radiodurans]|uniref:thermonuclease family protein n=1 Tax=Muricoccus radiodurans TaxID=2231721 RepID=UPI003CF95EFE
MLTRRRIFRPARSPRRWRGPLIALGVVAAVAGFGGIGLPPQLLGNSPQEQEWTAVAAEVRVVDGETLRLADRVVRLRGLEAPARGEACLDSAGRSFDCGGGAAEALARLVAGRDLSCRVRGRDRFGRALGQCEAGGVALNGALVSAGWALGREGNLPTLEASAQAGGRGLWTAGGQPPADWRGRR